MQSVPRRYSLATVSIVTPLRLPAMFRATPFTLAQPRLEAARRAYFEDGIVPQDGAVPPAILASWQRCLAAGADPAGRPRARPVSPRRARAAVQANEALLAAARPDLALLQQLLGATPAAAVLTDALGVVAHATLAPAGSGATLLPDVTRVGADLSEARVGTGTPSLVALTGEPCVVRGAEHFFRSARRMHCAAAPVRDARGRLAGALSLFSEHGPFAFDAAAIVAAYAASIEARLLRAQPGDVLLVQIAASPLALDTPAEGLLGVTGDGRIAWRNAAAAALCGAAAARPGQPCPLEPRALMAQVGQPEAGLLRLPGGLGVWVRASLPAGATASPAPTPCVAAPEASPAAPTLRAADARLIETTLAAHHGNVSRAARALGISRGRIYRHLQARRG